MRDRLGTAVRERAGIGNQAAIDRDAVRFEGANQVRWGEQRNGVTGLAQGLKTSDRQVAGFTRSEANDSNQHFQLA